MEEESAHFYLMSCRNQVNSPQRQKDTEEKLPSIIPQIVPHRVQYIRQTLPLDVLTNMFLIECVPQNCRVGNHPRSNLPSTDHCLNDMIPHGNHTLMIVSTALFSPMCLSLHLVFTSHITTP